MKPFRVYNYSCSLGPAMALPAAAAQLKARRADAEPTQSKHTRRQTDTPTRTRLQEAVFLTLRAQHTHTQLLSKLFYLFFFFSLLLFFAAFAVSFLAFLLLIYGTKIMLYCPRGAELPLLAGSVWDYTVMWALGFFLGQWKIALLCQKRSMTNLCWKLFRKTQKSVHNKCSRGRSSLLSQLKSASKSAKWWKWPQGGTQ